MEKAKELADKLIDIIDTYCGRYYTGTKTIRTEESIKELNKIVEGGFSLYKYAIEKKLYENHPELSIHLDELGKYIEKLQINAENAKKIHLSDALMIWDQCVPVIATVACDISEMK